MQQTPRGAADARQQKLSGPRVSNSAQLCIQALRADPKGPPAQFRRRELEQGLGLHTFAPGQGWLRLAVVTDLLSRKIVGWSTRPTIAREIVLDAVLMAVRRRQPRRTLTNSKESDEDAEVSTESWELQLPAILTVRVPPILISPIVRHDKG